MTLDTCVDCGATPPEAESSYTAIGQGWRVRQRATPTGPVLEWRCAACWKASRAGKSKSDYPRPAKTGTAAR